MTTRTMGVFVGALLGTALFGSAAAEGFLARRFPVNTPQATLFFADVDGDGSGDFCVLDGDDLRVYPFREEAETIYLRLERGTTAFDVADVDADGVNELITVSGDRILRYEFDGGAAPRELFRLDTRLGRASMPAYPHVLAAPYEGRVVLALPRENAIELRSADGELVGSYPLTAASPLDATQPSPFEVVPIEPPQAGRAGALEFRVSSLVEHGAQLPEPLRPRAEEARAYRIGTPLQTREAAEKDPSLWPWFPLSSDGRGEDRVLYALAPPDYRDTLIRLRRRTRPDAPGLRDAYTISPGRLYPGLLIPPRTGLPDFNGDGFTDLLCWNAPLPGMSVDSLARALHGRLWPLSVTVHLYDPKQGLYAGRPDAHIQTRLPLGWLLEPLQGAPVRYALVADVNGDGMTDLGMGLDRFEYGLWLFRDGFAPTPNVSHRFREPIEAVDQWADLNGDGRYTLIVRTRRAFYALTVPHDRD